MLFFFKFYAKTYVCMKLLLNDIVMQDGLHLIMTWIR